MAEEKIDDKTADMFGEFIAWTLKNNYVQIEKKRFKQGDKEYDFTDVLKIWQITQFLFILRNMQRMGILIFVIFLGLGVFNLLRHDGIGHTMAIVHLIISVYWAFKLDNMRKKRFELTQEMENIIAQKE